VHRTLVLAVTPVSAAPVVAVFLVVGGTAARPVAGEPVPVVAPAGCRPPAGCPVAFARPLEC